MTKPTRDELIADAIEASHKLYTVEDVVTLTGRQRQAIERLIRTRRINALIDTDPAHANKYFVLARQVAQLLRTPQYGRAKFVEGMPLDEARRRAAERRRQRGITIKVEKT
jgi:hypothetical protein